MTKERCLHLLLVILFVLSLIYASLCYLSLSSVYHSLLIVLPTHFSSTMELFSRMR